ncbi:MAG: hypothetical protein WC670_04345 [Pseudolabrys sp.]|jgi:hypothetical protein
MMLVQMVSSPALAAAGAFVPGAAGLYGLSSLPIGSVNLLAIALACITAGTGIHVAAAALIGRLRE